MPRLSRPIPLGVAAGALLCAALWSPGGPRRIASETFDDAALGRTWVASGPVTLERARPPEAATTPGGPFAMSLHLRATDESLAYTARGHLPEDWRAVDSLSLWVYVAGPIGSPEWDVQLVEADGKARLWRGVDRLEPGWHRLELPLRWFRWGEGRVPRLDALPHLGVHLRGPGELWIDTIAAEPGERPLSAEASGEDLAELAFPDAQPSGLIVREDGPVRVLTDCPDLDVDALATHLAEVVRAIREELPFLARPESPAALIVFGSEQDYRDFVPRYAARLGGSTGTPRSVGHTLQAVAASYWDLSRGSLRPVYTHEFVHAYLARAALLPNSGEWLQEGLASRYQLRFHPQPELTGEMRRALSRPAGWSPLADVLDGGPVAMEQYWQAAAACDLLLSGRHRQETEALFRFFDEQASTDLGPALQPVLHTDWKTFTAEWAALLEAGR